MSRRQGELSASLVSLVTSRRVGGVGRVKGASRAGFEPSPLASCHQNFAVDLLRHRSGALCTCCTLASCHQNLLPPLLKPQYIHATHFYCVIGQVCHTCCTLASCHQNLLPPFHSAHQHNRFKPTPRVSRPSPTLTPSCRDKSGQVKDPAVVQVRGGRQLFRRAYVLFLPDDLDQPDRSFLWCPIAPPQLSFKPLSSSSDLSFDLFCWFLRFTGEDKDSS